MIKFIFDKQKMEWLELQNQYEHYKKQNFVRPFFEKETEEQIGLLVY